MLAFLIVASGQPLRLSVILAGLTQIPFVPINRAIFRTDMLKTLRISHLSSGDGCLID
jgi:hypothetical protein